MGGAQSLYDETDWELADGLLRTSEETIDGRIPNASTYDVLYLTKRSLVANQRELDVTDMYMNLLYHIKPSPGTIAGFDVIGPNHAQDYKLRVTVDIARRYWIIYRFNQPIYNGQLPDTIATEKFALEQQQIQAQQSSSIEHQRKDLAARISASLAIHSFSDDTPIPVDTNNNTSTSNTATTSANVVESIPPKPKHLLYKVACVTVSWSRFMAVAAYYGPPTIEQIMNYTTQVEYVKKIQKKKQRDDEEAKENERNNHTNTRSIQRVKSTDTDDDDDGDGDILREARKIAGRLRSTIHQDDVSENSDIGTTNNNNNTNSTENVNIVQREDGVTNITDTVTTPANLATTIANDNDSNQNIDEITNNCNNINSIVEDNADEGNTNGYKRRHNHNHHSLADDLVDESESEVDQNNNYCDEYNDDNHHNINNKNDSAAISISNQELEDNDQHLHLHHCHTTTSTDDAVDKIDALEIQTSVSMPELSHTNIVTSSDSVPTSGTNNKKTSPRVLPRHVIKKWWQDSSRTLHVALLNPKSVDDTSNSTTTATASNTMPPPSTCTNASNTGAAAAAAAIPSVSNSSHSSSKNFHNRSGSDALGGGNVVSSFFGGGSSSNNTSLPDDPLQGVIHLDKPLLLCQEIYTRIIGNHQTSIVSKEKVLTLLRQDMEQHVQNKDKNDDESDNDDDNDNNNKNDDVTAAVNTEALASSLRLEQNTSDRQQTTISEEAKTPSISTLPCESDRTTAIADGADSTTKATIEASVPADESTGEDDTTTNRPPPPSYDPPPPPPSGNDTVSTTTEQSTKASTSVDEKAAPIKEQPLVGYWVWENTLRTHKMKMTVAKGTDVALHVVLAVLVNQVRYERNAIAIAV